MVHIDKVDANLAVAGGVLISLGIYLSLLLYGRMTNLSEIFNSFLKLRNYKPGSGGGLMWKFTFFSGFLTVPLLIYYLSGNTMNIFGAKIQLFDDENVVS
jgi:hypothetical protein